MNCENFEAIITDIAREQILEAGLRTRALLHVEECKACAALLNGERKLTKSLRAFATMDATMEAPARIEANLLAKFRESAMPQATPVVVPMTVRATFWQRYYPQAAAAAVFLVLAVVGAITLRMREAQTTPSQPAKIASTTKATQTTPASAPVTPATVSDTQEEERLPATASNAGSESNRERGLKYSGREAAAIVGLQQPRRTGESRVPKSGIAESQLNPTDGEIATDFIPVSYGDNLNSVESGRIVRVEMPRSALAQMGLPVNMDRANDRIKADVLIGEDGMARAIRFVR